MAEEFGGVVGAGGLGVEGSVLRGGWLMMITTMMNVCTKRRVEFYSCTLLATIYDLDGKRC